MSMRNRDDHGRIVGDGRGKTGAYRSWCSMRARCRGVKKRDRKYYTDRGITVCDRWEESFDNFLADMGDRPLDTTLDRINNDGNYEPGNCRWADRFEQARNRPSTFTVLIEGEHLSLQMACIQLGLRRDAGYKVMQRSAIDAQTALRRIMIRKNIRDGRPEANTIKGVLKRRLSSEQITSVPILLAAGRTQQSLADEWQVSRSLISIIIRKKAGYGHSAALALAKAGADAGGGT